MTRADLVKGTLLMIVVVLIWGTFLPVSKLVLAVVDPYYLTGIRYGIAALVFCVLLARMEGRDKLAFRGKGRVLFLFGSAGFAGFSILVYEGLRLTRPEHGAMILALTPVFVALYQWIGAGRRPRAFTLGCILLALAGEALVVSEGDFARLYSGGSALGNLLTLAACVFWTIYTLGQQRLPGWSPVRYTALSASLGWISIALITALATAVDHSRPPQWAGMAEVAWALGYVVIVVSIVAMLCWNTAVRHIGPLNAALFANFAPVVTFAIAVWQGRTLHRAELAGAAMVIGALLANNLFNRRLARRAEAVMAAGR